MWTMDELVERVGRALAAEYPGAPNGRIRDVPDRRAIRWYATTGLVDRPACMRGRTALYGPRHLLQLVALKRRQAEGRSLAEIHAATARPVGGVALGGGAILVLGVRPDAADYAAIATAAQPLLDLLADRGLLTDENPDDGSP
jgi:DNA-binding transcriptional MerR regulator